MLNKKLSNKWGEREIILLLFFGVVIIKFFKELNSGDGDRQSIDQITKKFLRCWFPKYFKFSTHKYLIYPALQFMVLGTVSLRKEEIFIIGEYGQEDMDFSLTKTQ